MNSGGGVTLLRKTAGAAGNATVSNSGAGSSVEFSNNSTAGSAKHQQQYRRSGAGLPMLEAIMRPSEQVFECRAHKPAALCDPYVQIYQLLKVAGISEQAITRPGSMKATASPAPASGSSQRRPRL